MITEGEVRSALADLLAGRQPAARFEEWLAVKSLNMHRDSTREAVDLVGAVGLALAESSSGHISRAELKARLASLLLFVESVQGDTNPVSGAASPSRAASTSRTLRFALAA